MSEKEHGNGVERYLAHSGTSMEDGPIHLIKGKEEIVDIIPVPIFIDRKISPIEALLKVSQIQNEAEIGTSPLLASTYLDNNTDTALRLFMAEFGRDSLETAKSLIGEYPKVALKTLRSLASSQGLSENPKSEEEEGKILHENRDQQDPVAIHQSTVNGWEWPYYGAIDATLLYIQLGGSYARRYGREFLDLRYTNRKGESSSLRSSFKLALNWAEKRVNKSPLKFVEYSKEREGGIENKVWRDSWEGYHHEDGSFADNTHGIASFSVQVDAYKAYRAATFLFPEKEREYSKRASYLKNKIPDHFWVEDEDYFALGSQRDGDGKSKLLRVKTSDMGHILESGILTGLEDGIRRKREAVIEMLFSEEMMNTSGIRTLSNKGVRFNAGAYHNGSVWPRENIKIARGLEAQGYYALARELHKRNINIWERLGVFPELVRGDDAPFPQLNTRIVRVMTQAGSKPYLYNLEQPGQLIQAWSVAAILQSMKQMERYEAGDLPESSEDPNIVKFEQKVLNSLEW